MADQKTAYASEEPDVRMVLVGKTGTGKSAVGNTILRKNLFISRPCTSSVTSECEKKRGHIDHQKLTVIDTPGLFDTKQTNKEILMEIARCISMAAPGPHVFLIVLQLTRFTKEEQDTVKIIQARFGEEASKYTMALFTHGDVLKEQENRDDMQSLISQNESLSDFIDKCQGGYHVFDNNDKNPAQVRELLLKINKMVKRNGESYYTNDMFKEAEKANKEEMEKLLRENPNMTHEEAREKAEKDNSFIRNIVTGFATGAATGFGIGTAVGFAAGPVGAGLGAVAGVGAAAAYTKKICIIL